MRPAAREPLDVGRLVRQSIGVLRANIVSVVLISMLFAGAPAALQSWVLNQCAHFIVTNSIKLCGLLRWSYTYPGLNFTFGIAPVTLLESPARLFINLIGYTAIAPRLLAFLDGRRNSGGVKWGVAARRAWKLILLFLVKLMFVSLGLLLVVAPGLFLLVRWGLSAPALLSEGLGVRASLGRSARLTRGRLGGMFGIWAAYVVATGILLGSVKSGANALTPIVGPQIFPFIFYFGDALVNAINWMVGAALITCLYHQCRGAKDRLEPQSIAAAFD